MKVGWALVLGTTAATAALGCWSSSETATLGLEEPIRVHNGTLHQGELPGSPPLSDAELDAGVAEATPHVTTVNSLSSVLRPGEVGKSLGGGVTDSADSIAVRFADIGTGYWVVPAAGPDPSKPGELTWSMSLDVAPDAPAGLHKLGFVGVDATGDAGTQTELDFCIGSKIPDNLNACDPTIAPPFAVLSLSWDTNSDLDLELQTPTGAFVDGKHPSTAPGVDGGVAPITDSDGVLDHDSNRACVIDGLRREDIVWKGRPRNGQYLVYVNMFDACGQPDAHFTVTLYLSEQTGKQFRLVPSLTSAGVLLAKDQNEGAGAGLFVTQFHFD